MHLSLPVTGADFALKKVLFLRARPRVSYKCLPSYYPHNG